MGCFVCAVIVRRVTKSVYVGLVLEPGDPNQLVVEECLGLQNIELTSSKSIRVLVAFPYGLARARGTGQHNRYKLCTSQLLMPLLQLSPSTLRLFPHLLRSRLEIS